MRYLFLLTMILASPFARAEIQVTYHHPLAGNPIELATVIREWIDDTFGDLPGGNVPYWLGNNSDHYRSRSLCFRLAAITHHTDLLRLQILNRDNAKTKNETRRSIVELLFKLSSLRHYCWIGSQGHIGSEIHALQDKLAEELDRIEEVKNDLGTPLKDTKNPRRTMRLPRVTWRNDLHQLDLVEQAFVVERLVKRDARSISTELDEDEIYLRKLEEERKLREHTEHGR